VNCDRTQHNVHSGPVGGVNGHFFHRIERFVTANDMCKDSVCIVQMLMFRVCNEKLAQMGARE